MQTYILFDKSVVFGGENVLGINEQVSSLLAFRDKT